MKKIVALVLSLVMALSLCTVAFAVTYEGVSDNTETPDSEKEAITTGLTFNEAKDATATELGWVAHYSYVDEKQVGHWYVECSAADKTMFVKKSDGGVVTYIPVKEVSQWEVLYFAKATFQAKKDVTCTETGFTKDGYYTVDDKDDINGFYLADAKSHDQVLVDGKLITVDKTNKVNDCVITPCHVLVMTGKKTDKGVAIASCKLCGATFAVTNESLDVAASGVNEKQARETAQDYNVEWAKKVVDARKMSVPYNDLAKNFTYMWTLTAGTTTGTTSGVNSAKTFDAGVAMYVGMSLLSVAGGAVVIGKKKEF